jgi:hypothetical protein
MCVKNRYHLPVQSLDQTSFTNRNLGRRGVFNRIHLFRLGFALSSGLKTPIPPQYYNLFGEFCNIYQITY